MDFLVNVVLLVKREIKETLEILAILIRLVKQEPLVSLQKQVQQGTLVTLELLGKSAMSKILVLWKQLDSQGKLVSQVKLATQALLDKLHRLALQVKKETKAIRELMVLQGKQIILVL